ncbi:MAG: carbohydrate ABC transporter permease [Candidatus Humimicrobiaceae bacterium]
MFKDKLAQVSFRDQTSRFQNYKRQAFQRFGGYLYIGPALILLIAIIIYPVLRTIILSFSNYDLQSHAISFAGIKHYAAVMGDSWFWTSLGNTLIFTIGSVILHLMVAFPLALILNRDWKIRWMRSIFRGFWILPWLFATSTAALMWGILFHPFGIINYYLLHIGLVKTTVDFLGNTSIALWSLVLVNVWRTFPIYMVLILGALQSIPKDLNEAAKIDGATGLKITLHITVPLITPTLLTIITLDFITTFGHFDLVRIMTGGGPLRATETLSYYIYRIGIKLVNYPYASALSTVMFILLAIFAFIYIKLYTRSSK